MLLVVFIIAYYESLQDKLQQIWDARAALDALREENREEERKRQEEAERARQMQMAHKLEIMRQRKHVGLENITWFLQTCAALLIVWVKRCTSPTREICSKLSSE